ncbi:MAG: hypothetical protein UY77_C0034G0004 [Candidatus Uhrbacteria bacterium GW2011_GWA2_53_10]|uniref:Uncharacterized protein n=1 Tax=Candidatus Uhrbacteria bacterium GW2011_GWA2_53_10 TaxID=1618980 RepID=A0A0G2AHW3_9BACT|nr:MAG: hypothetical protein UY77_C0034G0004 [Candidatus Uhrbacteria bacterium GW2011_GWA2_53_10]
MLLTIEGAPTQLELGDMICYRRNDGVWRVFRDEKELYFARPGRKTMRVTKWPAVPNLDGDVIERTLDFFSILTGFKFERQPGFNNFVVVSRP